MKNYTFNIDIKCTNMLEAKNKKEAIKLLKEIYRENYNIFLYDKEITFVYSH